MCCAGMVARLQRERADCPAATDGPDMNYPPGIAGQPSAALRQRLIEVGAGADELDLWKAKEAIRQAELRIAAQTGSLRAAETRATSLIGWAAVLASAAVAFATGGLNTLLGAPPAASVAAATRDLTGRIDAAWCLTAGALACIACALASIWPRRFYLPGHHPNAILGATASNELVLLRRLAKGHGQAVEANARRLTRAARWLWAAYAALLAGIALAGLVMTWPRLPGRVAGWFF